MPVRDLSIFRLERCRPLLLCAMLGVLAGLAGLPDLTHAAPPGFGSVSPNTAGTDVTSLTINAPTGITANDLLLAVISTDGSVTFDAPPTGWTLINQGQSDVSASTLAVFYKIAGSAEPAAYTFTWTAVQQAAGAILRYTGVETATPINAFATAIGTSAAPTAPSVTTSVADTMVVRIFGADDNETIAPPAGNTERVNLQSTTGTGTTSLGVADRTQAAAGVTGSAAFTYGDNEEWRAMTVALNPSGSRVLGCADFRNNSTSPTNLSGVVNTYYPGVNGTVNIGTLSVPVGTARGAATPIASGDLLLVMQMQYANINSTNTDSYGDGVAGGSPSGATSYVTAGYYEYVVATGAVSGGAVPISGEGPGGGLLNTYVQAATTATQGQRSYQVVRVPQYQTATVTGVITAAVWNGSSGGVTALEVVGQLTFSGGAISVNGQGFRGGGGQGLTGQSGVGLVNTDYRTLADYAANGNKGESVAGPPRYMYDGSGTLVNTGVEGYPNGSRARGAPGNGGGGGTDGNPSANDQNSGGGGGGNGGAGGQGGNTWSSNLPLRGGYGGAVFPHAAGRLAMGGGGGSGTRNDSTGVQSSGGPGGGIIMIRADSITGSATLSANGSWPAIDNYTPANDGGGGGGAGGSVLVLTRTGNLSSLTITANGANGANSWPTEPAGTPYPGARHGPGGGGGGGVIYLSSAAGSTSVTGGIRGITTTALDPYGAISGNPGLVSTGLTATNIPGTGSDATCAATLAGIADFRAVHEGGRVVLEWRTSFEIGTVGFHVERLEPLTGAFERINERLLPGLMTAPQGGTYRLVDESGWPGASFTYRLVELQAWGGIRMHGPYTVGAESPPLPQADESFGADASSASAPRHNDPARGYRATANRLQPKGWMRKQGVASAGFTAGGGATARTAQTDPKLYAAVPAVGAAQVRVREEGLVFIGAADLAAAMGVAESEVRGWIPSGQVAISQNGQSVAWLEAAEGSGLFFYGQRLDSLYTLDNVYCFKSGPGKKIRVLAGNAPRPVAVGVFTDTTVFEKDLLAATFSATDPEADYWFWEGFIGDTPDWSSKSFSLNLPEAAAGISLTVRCNGVSAADHPLEVWWNGERLGSDTWRGLGNQQFTFSLAGATVLSGDNSVQVVALGDAENMFFLDSFEVTYKRLARAAGEQLRLAAAVKGVLTAEGFHSPELMLFDITNPRLPISLEGFRADAGQSDYRVSFLGQAGHRYLLMTDAAVRALQPRPALAGNLQKRDRVDYIVITSDDLADGAQALATFRGRRGFKTRVVALEAIYNEFNHGIVDPRAIRTFLQHAKRNWGSRYAVLVGSGTYDYRNLEGRGDNRIPTLMTATPYGLYACDGCFADFLGNGMPQLVVSRIPAADAAQLQVYLNKLKAYEASPVAAETRRVLMLADAADARAGDFPRDSDEVASLVAPDIPLYKVHLGGTDPDTARQLTIDRINSGVFWVNYIGHGGMDRLANSGVLTTEHLADLHNANALPVLSALTCAVNRFEVPGFRSLGEELVLDAEGGAIAVWAPSGLSINEDAVRLNKALFAQVFQADEPVLGDAALQALSTRNGVSPFMLRIYNLLGDGALLLKE
jgi:hypothetical protein